MDMQDKGQPEVSSTFAIKRRGAVCAFVLAAATTAMPLLPLPTAHAQSPVRAGQPGRSQTAALPAMAGISKLPTQSAGSGLSPAALRAADALFAQTLKASGNFNLLSAGSAGSSKGRGASKQMASRQAGYALRATVLQWSAGTRPANGSESTSGGKGAGRGMASGPQAVVQIQVVDPRTQLVVATARGMSASRGFSPLPAPAYALKTPGGRKSGYGVKSRQSGRYETQGLPSLPTLPTGGDPSSGYTLPQNGGGNDAAGNYLPQNTGAIGQAGYPAPGQNTGYSNPGQSAGYPMPGQSAAYPMPGQSTGGAYSGTGEGGSAFGGTMPQGSGDQQALQQAFLDALRQILSLMERMLSMSGASNSGIPGGMNNGNVSPASPFASFPQPGGAFPAPGGQSYNPAAGGGFPGGSNPAWPERGGAVIEVQARVRDSRGLPLAHKQITRRTHP